MRLKLLTVVHQSQKVKCSLHALEFSHSSNIFFTIRQQIDLSEEGNDVLFGQMVPALQHQSNNNIFLNIFLYSDRAIKHTGDIALFLSVNNERLTSSAIYQHRQCVHVFRFLCLLVVDNALALLSPSQSLIYPKFS